MQILVEARVLWWRAVGSAHNGYAVEIFLDQVAPEAEKDPREIGIGF
ncbi:MAG: hypothetical protein H2045_06450 [Rhizobiales bacterium]|nr:hypothetical protein [Hyphomicrobiales bacterium]